MIRRLLCVLALLAGGLVLPGTPAVAGTPAGTYKIRFEDGPYCVEVTSGAGGTSDRTQLWQWSCNGHSNQSWRAYRISCGGQVCFLFVNEYSGKCMARAAGGTANGTHVVQWPCSDSNSTEWWFWELRGPAVGGWHWLSAYTPRRCLQHHNPLGGNGDPIDIWACDDGILNSRLLLQGV